MPKPAAPAPAPAGEPGKKPDASALLAGASRLKKVRRPSMDDRASGGSAAAGKPKPEPKPKPPGKLGGMGGMSMADELAARLAKRNKA